MCNNHSLIERFTIGKVLEGELRTIYIDLHMNDNIYQVYMFDHENTFDLTPFEFSNYDIAIKALFIFADLAMQETVLLADTPIEFAERIHFKMKKIIQIS